MVCSWNIAPTRVQLTHVSPRVPVQEVKLMAVCRRLIVHLSSCTHGVCVAPAPSHHRSPAHAIHGYCCQCVCAHVSWDSLLLMVVFAQAISVHGQTVCLTTTLLLRIQTCLAMRGNMVKRLPGTTGTGLFPRCNTRRTVIPGGGP